VSETKSSAGKLQKDLAPIPEVPYKFDALVRNSMQSSTFSLSGSKRLFPQSILIIGYLGPKLNHFEYPPALARRNSRKMSEDILHTKNYSLFDVIM